MDLQKLKPIWKKYRLFLLVLFLGIGLMLLPTGEKVKPSEAVQVAQNMPGLSQELEQILGEIDGAGEVSVLLTQSRGEEITYQEDVTDDSGGGKRRQTVIVTDESRNQSGLRRSVAGPVYLGAIVVCTGGDNPQVRLDVIQAVSHATGLSTDKITVLKRKS